MQLQLALTVADRLHEALLVQGESLPTLEAARLLLAAPQVPETIAEEVIRTLIGHDQRFCRAADDGHLTLRYWEMPDLELEDVPFVALDLETTGSRPGSAKITEIGAVRLEGLKETAYFHTLVNPQRPIPPFITRITGITQEMVADAPRIDQVVPDLLDFLEGALIVAHNAPFDIGFLNYELTRLRGRRLGEGAFDTLPLARLLAPGLPNYRLVTVAEALGAPVSASHRALADARAAAHVFLVLVERLREKGVTRLGEARACLGPSARGTWEKLRLTRDLPQAPGVYRFLDRNGAVLYIGKAERLRERVRSHFVGGSGQTRGIRQALRLVDRIEWEETATPLEAVVGEQHQILSERPPCNLHGCRPETYGYLKVSGGDRGLLLSVSSRPPVATPRPKAVPRRRNGGDSSILPPLLLGPFRGQSRLRAAVDLLQRCYPIRSCTRRLSTCPCVRFKRQACLAPCTGDPEARSKHDQLVEQLLAWLGGEEPGELPSPLERVDEVVKSLSRQRRFEEAKAAREASENLLSVRRSYQALAEACALRFVALWPQRNGEPRASVRLNVVWDGRLLEPFSVEDGNLEPVLEQSLRTLLHGQAQTYTLSKAPAETAEPEDVPAGTAIPADSCAELRRSAQRTTGVFRAAVAVGQQELDTLLAIRRWKQETRHPHILPLPGAHAGVEERAASLERLKEEVRRLLADAALSPPAAL